MVGGRNIQIIFVVNPAVVATDYVAFNYGSFFFIVDSHNEKQSV